MVDRTVRVEQCPYCHALLEGYERVYGGPSDHDRPAVRADKGPAPTEAATGTRLGELPPGLPDYPVSPAIPIRYWKYDEMGDLREIIPNPAARMGLLPQAESIAAQVEALIDKMAKDTQQFRIDAKIMQVGGEKVIGVAAGFRTRDNWTVILSGDFRKDGKAAQLTVAKEW